MHVAALKLALALIALAGAVALVGDTRSAYSSASANAGSTFATAASFSTCPNQTVTAGYTTGLEYGRLPYSSTSLFAQGAGVSVDGAVARSGGYSLKVAAGGAAGFANWWWLPSQPTSVARFALRLNSLPAGNVAQLFSMSNGGGATAELRYVASSQKLALALTGATGGTPNVATASSTVTAGTWYVIEIRYAVGTTTHTGSWQINEVAQPPASVGGTATGVSQTFFGTRTTDTFTANYDDVLLSSDGSQYPLGDGRVRVLTPNGMGTHSGGAAFQDNDGTALDAASWQRLDEIPTNSTADYIQQTTAGGTSYAEITFADTTETCIRAAHGYMSTHSASSNQSNAVKLSIFDGSTESIVRSGNLAANVTVSRDYAEHLTPATSWTPSAINGLVARFGYGTDVAPVPFLDGVLVEYEVPQ